jgi:hypothetical protein
MRRPLLAFLVVAAHVVDAALVEMHAGPTLYPTGTAICDPPRAWNGYTVFVLPDMGAVLIDMNGTAVRHLEQCEGAGGGPTRVLPDGQLIGALGSGRPHQESMAIAQVDWNDLDGPPHMPGC